MTLHDLSRQECPLLAETVGEEVVEKESKPSRYVIKPIRSLESEFKDKVMNQLNRYLSDYFRV